MVSFLEEKLNKIINRKHKKKNIRRVVPKFKEFEIAREFMYGMEKQEFYVVRILFFELNYILFISQKKDKNINSWLVSQEKNNVGQISIEEVSIEGRLTQFQIEFIKGRELIPTKPGSDFNEESFVKKKLIDKLRSNSILILKEKIKNMEKFTIETETVLNQKVGQLECEVAEREAEIKDLKQQIKKIKKEFSTILKHTQFLNNYISQQKEKKKQRFIERLSSKQKKVGLSPNIKSAKSSNKMPERLSIKIEKGKQKIEVGKRKSLELIKIAEGVKKYRKQETQRLWR